jgi:lipoyl(octanoyl) transferase
MGASPPLDSKAPAECPGESGCSRIDLMEPGFQLPSLSLWIDATPHDGSWNMAADEVLLASSASPLLRVYQWDRAAISVGVRFDLLSLPPECSGLPTVKRPTGGGIVWHGADSTFTLVVPGTSGSSRFESRQSYRWLHQILADALSQWQGQPHELKLAAADSMHDACFDQPVLWDVMCNQRKVAGGAQRRSRLGFLHQGSIAYAALGTDFWAQFASQLAVLVTPFHLEQDLSAAIEQRAEQRRQDQSQAKS